MANRRMIASDIWRDEFVSSIDYFSRLLWIGMIVTCADDQGRLLDRAGFISADVFPGEEVQFSDIETSLERFSAENKILRYEQAGKKLIQVINWWDYQSPQWVMPSKYPAPNDWIDRVRMHTKDSKVHTENWESKGGFACLPIPIPNPLPYPIDDVEVDGNEESMERVVVTDDILTFCEITHLPHPSDKNTVDNWTSELNKLGEMGVTDKIMRQACKELTEKGTYQITSPKSIIKACGVVLASHKRKDDTGWKPTPIDSPYAGAVQR